LSPSLKLEQKISQGLRELAQQMRAEATQVEALLKDSCKMWQDWRDGLRLQLNARDKDLAVADAAIAEIQFALRQKGSPLQVALSRQNQRGMRPGIELCNDKAQHALHAGNPEKSRIKIV
jgi:hypothetical protein